MLGRARRHVERRVAVEEPGRLEHKSGPFGRHDRPVFGPGDVVTTQGVPQHDVSVLDRAVGLRPWPAVQLARVLVGVITRREPLIGMVRGDPQVPGRECGALGHRGVGVAEQQDVAAGDKLVRGLMPEFVPVAPIGDQPVPAAQRVDHALCLRLPAQRPFHRPERVAQRVARSRRDGLGVHLIDGVAQSVHRHVQAKAEEVLVMARQGLRCDQGAEVAGLARSQRAGQDDARELHLELDGAVLVEVPVERVLVIARRDDK